jgi:hypothetical protein
MMVIVLKLYPSQWGLCGWSLLCFIRYLEDFPYSSYVSTNESDLDAMRMKRRVREDVGNDASRQFA